MDQAEHAEQFVQHLTESQPRLYGYVYSLVGDHSQAADVVQETNLVLWRKVGEFRPDQPFLPWAFAIARFQVLAHLRDRRRDRLLLDAELAESLSGEVERQAEQINLVRVALRACLQRLPAASRELIERRYLRGMPMSDIAAALERNVGAIKVAILRARRQLADCVARRLAEGTRS